MHAETARTETTPDPEPSHDELCDQFGIPDEDREDIAFHDCCNCDNPVPCEAGYFPYAPAGLLWCRDCLEAKGGWCSGPYGAVVRDLEPDPRTTEIRGEITDTDFARHGRDFVAHAIGDAFGKTIDKQLGDAEAEIHVTVAVEAEDTVEITLRVKSEARAADKLANDWESDEKLDDDMSIALEAAHDAPPEATELLDEDGDPLLPVDFNVTMVEA